VAAGYDAGVRLGEVIERDMVAVPVSSKQRQLVVGAPSYLASQRAPKHPTELTQHWCIGWRPSPRAEPYRWEFEDNGREFDVAVNPRITTNDMWVMLRTAVAGGGLTFGMEETFRPYIQRGELVPLLQRFCQPFAGFYLYFPDRRNLAPKLRALVNHVRHSSSPARPLTWRHMGEVIFYLPRRCAKMGHAGQPRRLRTNHRNPAKPETVA
jgi:DNA-binding transcriptional LysR family regulator